jgi:signal transduction histidine kinase
VLNPKKKKSRGDIQIAFQKKLSLRYVLIVLFFLQIIASVSLIGWLSFRNGKQAVHDFSAQLLNEINERVEERLEAYIAIPPIVNQNNMNTIKNSLLDIHNEAHIEKYLVHQLQTYPMITFSLYGEENTRYFCAIRQKDKSLQMLRMHESDENLYFYNINHLGHRTTLIKTSHIGDPRNRPWYQAAKKAGKPTWTPIYPSNATQDLSITAVCPVYDISGNLQGVLGTAFQFQHFNRFLRNLNISPHGVVYLMENSGKLISSSTDEIGFLIKERKIIRIKASESKNKTIRLSGKYIEDQFGIPIQPSQKKQFLNFSFNSEKYFLQISNLELHENINFLIVIIVPEKDFMSHIDKHFQQTILMCFCALIVSIIIGVLTSQWIIQPILRLNASAKEIAEGRWEKTIQVKRSDELGELSITFNQMAKQLKTNFNTMEKRVEERTIELTDKNKQLQQAKQKADVANKAKSNFLAHMNHELRTPLNVILGLVQILSQIKDISKEEQEYLSIIQRNGNHLLTLINQVLDFSKIEAGHVTVNNRSFDLFHLLNEVKNTFYLRARQKKLRLSVNTAPNLPRYVITDEVKLRQVLINLLSNAMKYTQKGGVRVEVSQEKENNNQTSLVTLQFSIKDTGAGIAPEEMNKLFEAFVQTEAGRKTQEGTGLGLPISRKFVQLMGGDITAKSKIGNGTTFQFTIHAKIDQSKVIKTNPQPSCPIALESGEPNFRLLHLKKKDNNINNKQLTDNEINHLLKKIPEKEFIDLKNAIEMLDYEMTKAVIKNIEKHNKLLGSVLYDLAEQFDFERMQKMISLVDPNLKI